MNKTSKIYVARHRGLAGSAIVRALQGSGHTNIITRTHAELDLINQRAIEAFYKQERPEYAHSPLRKLVASAIIRALQENSLSWDSNKPDSTPQKLLDVSNLKSLNCSARISLHNDLRSVCAAFSNNQTALEVHP